MGKVWTRDGQQQAQQPQKRAFFPGRGHPSLKRTPRVWKRESATSQDGAGVGTPNDQPSASTAQQRVEGEAEPVEEPSAKRRRLAAKGRVLPERWAEQVAATGAQISPPNFENGSKSELDWKAERAAKEASKQESLRREAAALRKQIAEEEAKVAAAKAAAQRKEAQQAAAERAKKEALEVRKNRLDAGFAEAFRLTRELAANQKVPVSAAEEAEVKRVLAAKSDHEVLQLQPGADRAAIRKTYRAMTLALHPDKCKAESATDAFQRLVLAYQGVLKYAR